MQRNFAETGAANSFLRLHEDVGASFEGCDNQREMTPLQRQIIEAAWRKEAEEKERKREEMREQSGGQQSGPRRNPRKAGAGSGRKQSSPTTRFINQDQNPDHEIHE